MNHRLTAIFIIMTALVICSPFTAFGQDDTPVSCADVDVLAASIDQLSSALRSSLDQQAQHQNLLIAIEYLQFRSRSIESLEAEVRRVEDRRTNSEERLARMKAEVESMENELAELPPEEETNRRLAIDGYRRLREVEEGRIDRYDRQILDLENQITEGRRHLLALEDFVIENLDLGG
jgi:chromosome segregation ATPase